MNTRISFLTIVISAVALWSGCTELKDGLPPPEAPGVQVHHPTWNDSSSPNFHGEYVKAKLSGDMSSCLVCHGQDYNGGTSKVSCVTCHEATSGTIHGKGWEVPGSANFHGNAIAAASWDMRPCQTCHGVTYTGGRVPSSCARCHANPGGPQNCATCHGTTNPAPPEDTHGNTARTARGVGAHQVHYVGGTLTRVTMHCQECHTVPGGIYDAGHIDATANAEVLLNSPLARTVTNEPTTQNYSPSLPQFTPNPSYSAANITCASTYCHGNFKNGNPTFAPVWNDATGSQKACGTCHGDVGRPTAYERALPKAIGAGGTHPPVTTPVIPCATCHIGVVDASMRIIDPSKHMNGKLNLGGQEVDF
ncbi:MAG: CxxxxCH/CxxCH domain-containing protein [Ignavibacteriae bacterium]|nr:CxxxxCH/CxxCH domain-containing protein [Ignavibacteriota bacterium]